MKICNIVPCDYIKDYSGSFVMALSCFLEPDKSNTYEEAILSANLPIVLDNGAFETGSPDGIDNLFRKAKRLKPKYIFAPDTLFDAVQTRKGYENFEYIKKQMGHTFLTAVVVQASNKEEYIREFIKYNEDPGVAVIGLSYLAISKAMRYSEAKPIPKKETFDIFKHDNYTVDRIAMMGLLSKAVKGKIKPCHILGLGESYDDVVIAKNEYSWCMYNDTSTCYMAAACRKTLTEAGNLPGGKIRAKINIQEKKHIVTQSVLQQNINKVNKLLCLKPE